MTTVEERERDSVWHKGHIIDGKDPALWRRDDYGCPMRYTDYGDRDSPFGWEKDHIIPKAEGGSDELINLRPLSWVANVQRNRK